MKTQEFIDTDLVSTLPSPNHVNSTTSKTSSPGVSSQSRAEIDARVEQARQQMLELRRQQEELERERQELEELRRREEEFEKGKAEMLEELSRTISLIEHEEFEINKRSSLLSHSREAYQDYVRQLQDIHENEWFGDELKNQLAKASTVVEGARAELNKGRAQLSLPYEGPVKLASDSPSSNLSSDRSSSISSYSEPWSFTQEIQRGIARNLPSIIVGVILLYMILSRKG